VPKVNIKNLSIDELSKLVAELDDTHHRITQVLQWLYQKGASNFDEMTNIPTVLRTTLDERFLITSLDAVDSVQSKEDASQKFLLSCDDGSLIETVLMEARGRRTVCISSQVGCPLACTFCRTGAGGFERNLRSDEILNQVLFFKSKYLPPRERYNIVLMGMGDPLLNIDNVGRALEIMNAQEGFALGEKRITVSTIGIPKMIDELAGAPLKFALAVSLNATTNAVRKRLMPRSCDLFETLDAAQRFARLRGTRITLEYVLIAGVNDHPEDARRLAAMTAGRPFKINLIPFNGWDGCRLARPSENKIEEFAGLLLPGAPAVTVRRSQGGDIDAACGQLTFRHR
jgi:23S rRNA (adenine2503-C2)-methyltransferase